MATLRGRTLSMQVFRRREPAARILLRQGNWRYAQHSKRSLTSSPVLLSSKTQRTSSVYGDAYNQRFPKPPLGSSLSSLIIGTIMAGCVGLYGYEQLLTTEVKQGSRNAYAILKSLKNNFVLSRDNIREGRYWVMLTSSFAHANFEHLLFNMLSLWGFGQAFIRTFGVGQFAVIWIGSSVVGSALQLGYWEKIKMPGVGYEAVGASGSIFGILSALSFVYPRMSVLLVFIPMPLRICMLGSAAFSLGAVSQGWLPWMGHIDHLGGMAFGFMYWLVVLRRVAFRGLF